MRLDALATLLYELKLRRSSSLLPYLTRQVLLWVRLGRLIAIDLSRSALFRTLSKPPRDSREVLARHFRTST